MSKFNFTIYTQKDISNQNLARKFFEVLEDYKIQAEKINLYEPITKEFTLEKAIEMWCFEENGCYEEGKGFVGKSGGILGKRKNPSYTFDVTWWKRTDKKMINRICFSFTVKAFMEYQEEIESMFRELLDITEALYGYITHRDALDRQHVTGTIETRLPGVFWCNYFSSIYVEFFTKQKILGFSWFKVIETNKGGLITYLTKYPNKEIIISENFEKEAKKHLGEQSFGNIERYKLNPFVIQICSVPKLG